MSSRIGVMLLPGHDSREEIVFFLFHSVVETGLGARHALERFDSNSPRSQVARERRIGVEQRCLRDAAD
jgi:hypothetical protein